MVEARRSAGFIRRRPLGRARPAIGSIQSAAGRRCRPDASCPAVVRESGRSQFASGNLRRSRRTRRSAEHVHTCDIVRHIGQHAASCLSKRRQFAGRQTHFRTKRNHEGRDHCSADIVATRFPIHISDSSSARRSLSAGDRSV
jgi:hypothetical protein